MNSGTIFAVIRKEINQLISKNLLKQPGSVAALIYYTIFSVVELFKGFSPSSYRASIFDKYSQLIQNQQSRFIRAYHL